MLSTGTIVLTFVTVQRLCELVLARRNTRRLIAMNAVEAAPGHYPFVVALHAAWLAGLWIFSRGVEPSAGWLVVFGVLQLLRVWVIASLGPRWTTRIIVVPGAPRVCRGPYRFMAHPNYAIVAAELAVLPIAFGLIDYAFLFSALNALVLFVRIRAENAALQTIGGSA
jgi:methyltransferase